MCQSLLYPFYGTPKLHIHMWGQVRYLIWTNELLFLVVRHQDGSISFPWRREHFWLCYISVHNYLWIYLLDLFVFLKVSFLDIYISASGESPFHWNRYLKHLNLVDFFPNTRICVFISFNIIRFREQKFARPFNYFCKPSVVSDTSNKSYAHSRCNNISTSKHTPTDVDK